MACLAAPTATGQLGPYIMSTCQVVWASFGARNSRKFKNQEPSLGPKISVGECLMHSEIFGYECIFCLLFVCYFARKQKIERNAVGSKFRNWGTGVNF